MAPVDLLRSPRAGLTQCSGGEHCVTPSYCEGDHEVPKKKSLYDTCSCLTNLPRSLLFDPVSNFLATTIALPVCVPPLEYFIFRIAL